MIGYAREYVATREITAPGKLPHWTEAHRHSRSASFEKCRNAPDFLLQLARGALAAVLPEDGGTHTRCRRSLKFGENCRSRETSRTGQCHSCATGIDFKSYQNTKDICLCLQTLDKHLFDPLVAQRCRHGGTSTDDATRWIGRKLEQLLQLVPCKYVKILGYHV